VEYCPGPVRADMEAQELAALRAKTEDVYRRLAGVFGVPRRRGHLDAVSELVSTILSQNTNDTNRDRAYQRLRERFPTWEEVRDADVQEVREAIRPAGLSETKAPRIQAALRYISQTQGQLTLDFLRTMPVPEAKRWLTGIKGVGPKTAAIILLFSFGRPAFPVDTHIHRVSKRLGLIGPQVGREAAHDIMEKLVPRKLYYPFHIDMIRHGREICQPTPRCELCPLRELCCYYRSCLAPNRTQAAGRQITPADCSEMAKGG